MTRFTKKIDPIMIDGVECVRFAYGKDHACGWFYQYLDTDDECVQDRDQLFHGITLFDVQQELSRCGLRDDFTGGW